MIKRLACVMVVGFGSAAGAVAIDSAVWGPCVGSASCSVLGGTVTIDGLADGKPAKLGRQAYRGVLGLGVGNDAGTDPDVNSGTPGPEIFGEKKEAVRFGFAAPTFVTGFTLAHFYNTDAFGSDPQEIALIEAVGTKGTATLSITNLGYSVIGGLNTADLLLAVSGTSATASAAGTPFAGKKANNAKDAGVVVVSDFFPELGRLTALTFTAAPGKGPKGSDGHDYSVASVTVAPVPLPAAAWLLAGGLAGLGFLARRSRGA